MALFTFSGGVHPADGKEFAKNSPITEYLPKGDVVLPLGQHIGAPAQPIVSKGDQVLVGQKVAEAGGFVSANIFSSVSGTVKAIEPRMTPAGAKVNSIVIENDGEFKEAAFEAKPYDQMSKDDVLDQRSWNRRTWWSRIPNTCEISAKRSRCDRIYHRKWSGV